MSQETAKFALDRAERVYAERLEAAIPQFLDLAPLIRSARKVQLERGDFKTPKDDLDKARKAYQGKDFDTAETLANRVYLFFNKDAALTVQPPPQPTQPTAPAPAPKALNISGNPQGNVNIPPMDLGALGTVALLVLVVYALTQDKKE